jgi:hypothetical protein
MTMYALRRTVAAFVLVALLFAPAAAIGAPPHVHTLAQVLANGNTTGGNPILSDNGAAAVSVEDDGTAILTVGSAVVGLRPNGDAELRALADEAWVARPDGRIGDTNETLTVVPSTYSVTINGNLYLILPTTDPGVAGAVWNDNGTVKVSAG